MPTGTPFNAPTAKDRSRVIKIRDGTDVAARYFVYKLYEATGGQPMQWRRCMGWASQRRPFPGRLSADGSFSRAWAQAAGPQGRVNRRRATAGAQGKIDRIDGIQAQRVLLPRRLLAPRPKRPPQRRTYFSSASRRSPQGNKDTSRVARNLAAVASRSKLLPMPAT